MNFGTQAAKTFCMLQACGQRFQYDKRVIFNVLTTEINPMIFVNGFTSCNYFNQQMRINKSK